MKWWAVIRASILYGLLYLLNIKLPEFECYNAARQSSWCRTKTGLLRILEDHYTFCGILQQPCVSQYTLVLNGADRNGLSVYLAEQKIPSMIYYPVPGYRQEMFASLGATV